MTVSPPPGSGVTDLMDDVAAAARQLAGAGIDSARTDAELIAAHVHGVPRAQLHTVRGASGERFWDAVRRRAGGEPLQHITGRAYFRYLELEVGPGVFIPRPETEVVTGWAVGWLRALGAAGDAGRTRPVAVDLGTGSGAIALAIAQEVPQARVHAVEAHRLALAWAERNVSRAAPAGATAGATGGATAGATGGRVTVHHGGLADALAELDGTADLVISNPPYIPEGSWVPPEVGDYDPPEALWGGPDGLDVVAAVERTAARLLRHGGVAVVEHGAPQGAGVRRVFARTGDWEDIATHRDLAGRDRFVIAVRSSPRGGRIDGRGRDDAAV